MNTNQMPSCASRPSRASRLSLASRPSCGLAVLTAAMVLSPLHLAAAEQSEADSERLLANNRRLLADGEEHALSSVQALRSETFASGERPFVEVDNLYGAVEVLAGEPGEVKVEARVLGKRDGADDSFRVEIARSAGGVRASASCAGTARRFAWCGRQRVDFVVHVPPSASLDLRGIGTDLRVIGVYGSLWLSTVSGSIDVRDAGLVRAESASGSVRVERAAAAEISAGDGNVELIAMRKGTAIYRHPSNQVAASDEVAVPGYQEVGAEPAERSLVVRSAESLLRTLLGALHRSSARSCGAGEEC